jgi:hypothetical protein
MSNITSLSTSEGSMDVLLSIKPKYVKPILEGEKKYEFRKVIFRNPAVSRVFIYSSAPSLRSAGSSRITRLHYGTRLAIRPGSITKNSSPISPGDPGVLRLGLKIWMYSIHPSIPKRKFQDLCHRSRIVIWTDCQLWNNHFLKSIHFHFDKTTDILISSPLHFVKIIRQRITLQSPLFFLKIPSFLFSEFIQRRP